jgi:hypothetical protein
MPRSITAPAARFTASESRLEVEIEKSRHARQHLKKQAAEAFARSLTGQ